MRGPGIMNRGNALVNTPHYVSYCGAAITHRNPDQNIITLGVELEMIINNAPDPLRLDQVYIRMVNHLNKIFLVNIPVNAYEHYKAISYMSEWHPTEKADLLGLGYDTSKGNWYNKRRFCVKFEQINGMPVNGTGVEIVTPIMRQGSCDYLVRGMLGAVSSCPLDVIINRGCGLHVHVGRRGGFGVDHLRRIAKAIIIFEMEMDKFHPPWRQYSNTYTKSNREMGDGFSTIIIDLENPPRNYQLVRILDALSHVEKVVAAMNGPIRTNKNFKYNFQSIFNYGTVEFRQARATLDVPWTLAWIKIVVAFVEAAINTEDTVFDQIAQDLDDIFDTKPIQVSRTRREMLKGFLALKDPRVFDVALWTRDEEKVKASLKFMTD